jgi:uncharacterized protein
MAAAAPAGAATGTAPDTGPFWTAAQDGTLVIQRCADCGRHQFYPTSVCRHCRSRDLELVAPSGAATVLSWTAVRRAPSAEFRDELPYVDALVELAEGLVLMCRVAAEVAEVATEVPVGTTGRVRLAGPGAGGRPRVEFHADSSERTGS